LLVGNKNNYSVLELQFRSALQSPKAQTIAGSFYQNAHAGSDIPQCLVFPVTMSNWRSWLAPLYLSPRIFPVILN
ncbi:MAG: hypothetical protein PHH57_08685, partial [Candidatus Omnitrophica bacterium]|nr:hypothetical protein [Candidatus Omnitrophota bacterium]